MRLLYPQQYSKSSSLSNGDKNNNSSSYSCHVMKDRRHSQRFRGSRVPVSTIRTPLPCAIGSQRNKKSNDSVVMLRSKFDTRDDLAFDRALIENNQKKECLDCCMVAASSSQSAANSINGVQDRRDESFEIEHHEDDSDDTYSEMTLSEAFSNSNSTTCSYTAAVKKLSDGDDAVVLAAAVDSESSSAVSKYIKDDSMVTNKNSSRLKLTDKSISGKMVGMTLNETLEWRRRVSSDESVTHKPETMYQQQGACAGTARMYAQQKKFTTAASCQVRNVGITTEGVKCPPEFMLVRARLKSAPRRERNGNVSRGSLDMESTAASSFVVCNGSTLTSKRAKYGGMVVGTADAATSPPVKMIHAKQDHIDPTSSQSTPIPIIPPTSVTVRDSPCVSLCSSWNVRGKIHQARKLDVEDYNNSKNHESREEFSNKTNLRNELNRVLRNRQSNLPRAIVSPDSQHQHDITATERNRVPDKVVGSCSDGLLEGESKNDMASNIRFKLNQVFSQRLQRDNESDNHRLQGNNSIDLPQGKRDYSQKLNHILDCEPTGPRPAEREEIMDQELDCRQDDKEQSTSIHSDRCNVRDPNTEFPIECEKYQKMLKLGLPKEVVKHAMLRDGMNPSMIFAETGDDNHTKKHGEGESSNIEKRFRRTRLHWEVIPEESVSQGCIWHEIALDSDIGTLNIEEQEFNALFQSEVISSVPTTPRIDCSNERAVKVIDPKRANNGGIILARLKMTYDEIARSIDTMNHSILTTQQIIGIMEFIPSKEESKLLGNFVKSGRDVSALCECEKFMLAIMPIQDAGKKLEAMLFKLQFPTSVKQLLQDVETLSKACDNILESVKLRKFLGVILKVGNRLNQAGVDSIKTHASGFTIDLLSKLNQVRACDKRTTILQYIICVIQRWNAPLLGVKDELRFVLKTQNIADYESSLCSLEKQINAIVQTAADAVHVSDAEVPQEESACKTDSMGQFVLDALKTLSELRNKHVTFKDKFKEVLAYLAQDETTTPDSLFGAITQFCQEVDSILRLNHQNNKYVKLRGCNF